MILNHILRDGVILSLITSLWLIITLHVNPRIFLHDYPPAIQEKVPPKTKAEKKLLFLFSVPYALIFLLGLIFSTLSIKQQALLFMKGGGDG